MVSQQSWSFTTKVGFLLQDTREKKNETLIDIWQLSGISRNANIRTKICERLRETQQEQPTLANIQRINMFSIHLHRWISAKNKWF